MRVIHTAAELNNEASGPSHSIPHTLYWLRALGVDVSLQALKPQPCQQLDFPQTYHAKWAFLRPLGISPSMRRELLLQAQKADIIHTHNLWMMPNIYPYAAAVRSGCKLVVSPRGTLTQWAFQYRRRKKLIIWSTLQKQVVMKADLIHATSEGELEDLRALGVKAPVAIIPNGVDLPRVLHTDVGDNVRRLLFLGRVHPKKGVDRLLKAWKLLAPKHPNWILEVVGPDNIGYKDRMKNFAEELALERVYFRDPVFGQEKERTYQQASLFVLPTRSDNFGIAVAEALANGVPAVVTKGAPWAGLETYDCGRWIDDQVEVIAGTLDEVMKLPEAKLLEMGNNGRRWVEEAFSWRSVAETMKKAYQWVLTGGERPPWIYI